MVENIGPDAAAKKSFSLIVACRDGDYRAVIDLLDSGVNVNAKVLDYTDRHIHEYGWTALSVASYQGNIEIVRLLLAKGADLNITCGGKGWTALMLASQEGQLVIVRALLAEGADINMKDDEGYSSLMLASQHNHTEVVNFLLDSGAEINAETSNGWTALSLAYSLNRNKIVSALLSRGANFSAKGPASNHRFIIQGDRAYDTYTDLTWKRDTVECCSFEEAQKHVGSGWRVPNLDELGSLVDCSRANHPYIPFCFDDDNYDLTLTKTTIDLAVFPDMKLQQDLEIARYWSSTPDSNDGSKAWYVDFFTGDRRAESCSIHCHVRLVHSGCLLLSVA